VGLFKLFFLLSVLLFSSFTWAKKPQLDVDLIQYGENVASATRQSTIWGAEGLWKFKYVPTLYLSEELNLATILETGSFRSRYTENGKPESRLSLVDAKINFLPNDYLTITAGAQSLNYFSAPMLFSAKSFVALSEELTIPLSTWKWKIFSWQASPKADSSELGLISLGPRDSYLLIGGTKLTAEGDVVKFNLSYLYFYFSNLFNSVAYESQFNGNSASGIGQNTTSFIYDYQGHHGSADWEFNPLGNISFKQKVAYLFNEKAPNRLNSGVMLENSLKLYDWFLTGTLFKIKRDAAVAYYNSSSMGNTNRDGFLVEVATLVPDIGGKMGLSYAKSSTIEKNIYQSDEQRVQFSWTQNFNLF